MYSNTPVYQYNINSNYMEDKYLHSKEMFNNIILDNKLSLRKKKINEFIISKRQINNPLTVKNEIINKQQKHVNYTSNDLSSGYIYTLLYNAINLNDELKIREIINQLSIILKFEVIKDPKMVDILKRSGSLFIGKNNTYFFPITELLVKIIKTTNSDYLFLLCINILLNFSFISDESCLNLSNNEFLNIIVEQLIKFYPNISANNNINNEKIQGYYVGSQVIKLLGNIFISFFNKINFNQSNFFKKIFNLFEVFDFENKNQRFNKVYFEYVDNLLWIITSFITKIKNIYPYYINDILNIIPTLIKDLKFFCDLKETNKYIIKIIFIIEKIFELNEIDDKNNMVDLNEINGIYQIYTKKMLESGILKIIIQLLENILNDNREEEKTDINMESIILIFSRIFSAVNNLNYRCDNIDPLNFQSLIEKLLRKYRLNLRSHKKIQIYLINILASFAFLNDNVQITKYIFYNKNIIDQLFKYYYKTNKMPFLRFILNIVENQNTEVIYFIMNSGGLKIVEENIKNFEQINNNSIIEHSIKIFWKVTEKEKITGIKHIFDKLNKSDFFDKVYLLYYNNNNLNIECKTILQKIMELHESYEKLI